MFVMKKILAKETTINILSWIALFLIKFVYFFTFVKYRGVEKLQNYMKDGKPIILVFWHSRSFLIVKFWNDKICMKKHPIYGIFSTHRDGKLIGKLFARLGVKNIMSSSKSVFQARGVAMKSMRLLKSGVSIGFTPGGPLGPRMHFVSDSSFLFAKASGAPIVPVYISASNVKIFEKSWDKFMLVKPFSKAIIEVGDFLFIDKNISDSDLKKIKVDFINNMVDKTLKLDREMKMPLIFPENIEETKWNQKKIKKII